MSSAEAQGVGRDASGPPAARPAGRPIGEFVFVALVLALGVFALVGTFGIRTPGSSTVGPTVFPLVVSVLLLGSGVGVLIGLLRGKVGQPEQAEDLDASRSTDWLTIGKLVGLAIAHLVLIPIIGWAFAAAILFGGAAWSLGARRWWVALLVGVALGIILQILFGELLGLSLPLGPALGWLGALI